MSDLLERVGMPSTTRFQNRYNSDRHWSVPVLSHPNSKLAVLAAGKVFDTAVYCLAGMGRKEVGEEIREFYPIPRIGLYDNEVSQGFVLNYETGDRQRAFFKHVDNLPILHFFYQYWEGNVQVGVREFVWNDVFYQIARLVDVAQGETVNILETFQFQNVASGYVEPAGGGYPPIVVVTCGAGYWAFTCTGMDEYYCDDVEQDPTTGSFDESKNTTTNEITNVGIGKAQIADGNVVVHVFAMSEVSGADAVAKAKDALDNWASYESQSEKYWVSKVKSVADLRPGLRYNAAVAIIQCLAQTYSDGFMVAGFPTWKDNFCRDTVWTAFGLLHCLPADARIILDWWRDVSDFTSGNNWKSDKVTHGVSNPTDYGAAFLIAVGEYYNATEDLTLIVSLYDRIMDMVNWAKSKYVEADKHILAPHPHDYWDDYTRLSSYPKKYESLIDVLWAEGLRRAAVYLKDYGDTSNADWCASASAVLVEGLEDYRTPEGGFWYCIDTNNEVIRELTSSASLFAALFLGDQDAWNWLMKNEQFFDLDTLDPPVICQFEWSDAPATDDAWSPYSALSSCMLVNKSNAWATLLDFLDTSALGVLKEGGASQDGHFIYGGGGAPSFPWTYGFLLYGLSNFREEDTAFVKLLGGYGEIVTVRRNMPETKDDFGNWIENWLDISSENALVQVHGHKGRMIAPGVLLSADAKGFFGPASVTRQGDRVVTLNGIFEVGTVRILRLRDRVHHSEVELKRVVEEEET